MGFLKKLSSLFTPQSASDQYSHWVVVRCNRCGELIRARVDMRNDLSIQYGERDDETTYFCRKVIVGDKLCFQPIEIELNFDARHRLVDQKIKGGVFLKPEEVDQAA